MKTRTARPMLRAASLTFGSLLAACGSAQADPDPIPPPGNPKGSLYDDAVTRPTDPTRVAAGTLRFATEERCAPEAMITVMAVSLDSLNVFASKRLPVVEGAQRFELTQADRLEGAPPLPRQFRVQATCDGASTGDEKTFFVGMALTSTDAAGIDLDLVLARQVLSAPPPRPIRGNPKGSLYNDRPKKP